MKVPWDQLKPILTSDLHEETKTYNIAPTPIDISVVSTDTIGKEASNVDSEISFVKKVSPKKRNPGTLQISKKVIPTRNLEKLSANIQRRGYWLADEHVDHSQYLLASQHGSMDGFQAACIFEPDDCQHIGTPNGKYVQIMNINNSHWVTISNVESTESNQLLVYDSLYNRFPAACEKKLYRQIACMLMTDQPTFILKWVDVQKQNNGSDCGLFAIAAATALCEGKSPQRYHWKIEEMRGHLADCIQIGQLSIFPFSSKTRRCNMDLNPMADIRVYCYCRQPRSEKKMIACGDCLQWFHRECCGVSTTNLTMDTDFVCIKCKNENPYTNN